MLLRNLLCLILSAATSGLLSWTLAASQVLPCDSWHLGLLILLPLGLLLNLVFTATSRSESFSQILLAGIVVKLLAALTAIVIYRILEPASFYCFSLHFITQYILFTIFEIRYLFYILKTREHEKTR